MHMNKPRLLSGIVKSISDPVFGKKSALYGQLVNNWHAIAGPELASYAVPLELKFRRKANERHNTAVLKLGVPGARVPDVMMQKDILIQKLNQFMGFNAIEDIQIRHVSSSLLTAGKTYSSSAIPLTGTETQKLNSHLDQIEDDELKSALAGLGAAVYSRQKGLNPVNNKDIVKPSSTEVLDEN